MHGRIVPLLLVFPLDITVLARHDSEVYVEQHRHNGHAGNDGVEELAAGSEAIREERIRRRIDEHEGEDAAGQ